MHTTRTTALGRIALATRIAAAAATVCAAQLAAAQSTLPSGVGIYLNVATLSAHGYNGNGSSDYASGPGISIYSGGGTNSSGGPLYAMTSAPLPLGATVGTLSAQGSDEPDHPVTATAASTADMSTGVLRVNAGGSGRGIAGAQMKDNLNFHVAGGGTADVTVTVHLDGYYAFLDPLYAVGSQAMGLSFAGAAFSEVGGASNVNGPSSYYGHNAASGYVPPYGWESYSFTNESATGFDFTGVVRVTDGQRAGLNLNLGTDCTKATSVS